ncbi:Putrescine transport ATP-binding protein PotA (TC 3.A.1.11.1) [Brenneria goodwinii]|uniref:Putrescine transport ATP-binding protein PotA (TC 3.A.1.11.1) n=1 Tax=Brenneria goodwinii TaxID=1109412 RepID=A0A0G4JNY1_9GAMM|nr:Putrescine transport ATP-binding protein PotA (TC 3.A.1.11.1) [Brenneria goodwinii]
MTRPLNITKPLKAIASRPLDDLSFSVKDNEFVTLLGPSGCGKTTLLRIISGFEQLDAGELLILGKKMNHITAAFTAGEHRVSKATPYFPI